eukprot:1080601-Prymnesium_polylepis.1
MTPALQARTSSPPHFALSAATVAAAARTLWNDCRSQSTCSTSAAPAALTGPSAASARELGRLSSRMHATPPRLAAIAV